MVRRTSDESGCSLVTRVLPLPVRLHSRPFAATTRRRKPPWLWVPLWYGGVAGATALWTLRPTWIMAALDAVLTIPAAGSLLLAGAAVVLSG